MIISSKQNKIIKFAKQLQTKKFVELFGKCFLETEKIIKDIKKENIDTILVSEHAVDKHAKLINSFNAQVLVVSESVCKYLSQTESGSDIFAIYNLIKNQLDLEKNTIILDGVQHPSNLGAIIRSALAFDFHNIIAINSAFPYTHKVIRSSMGYVFKVNYVNMKIEEFIELKEKWGIKILVAKMKGKDITTFKNKLTPPFGLVIGNEGEGVSSEMLKVCDEAISISMQNKVESLNAAVSAAILMHQLTNNK